MLLATGDALYADAAERMLHNGFAAGVSLGGGEYFYVNPLQLRSGAHADDNRSPAHGRRGWFDCACCPPNVMRTLASLSDHLATSDPDGVQIQLYADGVIEAPGVRLEVGTAYPWEGAVRVRVAATPGEAWTLSLRVPAWAEGARLDGEPVTAGGYATVRRRWSPGDEVVLELPMEVRVTGADERVDAVRGCVAIERGPLVYAVEDENADDFRFAGVAGTGERDGMTTVEVDGTVRDHERTPWPYPGKAGAERPARATAVPYFAWANHGVRPMRVWLPDGRR
jgi:DUF1680 family protein